MEAELNYVLVIEDEYLIASDLRQAFDLAGVRRVEIVANIASALSLLRERSPDGVILDLNLCGRMASPVADVLARRKIPFVFMTGHDRSVIPRRFSRVIRCEKPIEPTHAALALLRTVHTKVQTA